MAARQGPRNGKGKGLEGEGWAQFWSEWDSNEKMEELHSTVEVNIRNICCVPSAGLRAPSIVSVTPAIKRKCRKVEREIQTPKTVVQ